MRYSPVDCIYEIYNSPFKSGWRQLDGDLSNVSDKMINVIYVYNFNYVKHVFRGSAISEVVINSTFVYVVKMSFLPAALHWRCRCEAKVEFLNEL